MFVIHTEMPSGAISRGYEYEDALRAAKAFARVAEQLGRWRDFVADVVLLEEGVEAERRKVRNAA